MTWPRSTAAIGAACGFAVAVILTGLGLAGVARDGAVGSAVSYLIVVPPLLVPWLRRLSDSALIAVLIVWWVLAGSVLGWCVGKGVRGRAAAIVLVAAVAAGHVHVHAIVGAELQGAVDAFARILGAGGTP